ncbi:MAG: ASKHA domain-containing protein [Eubacteriaceae bacterium]|nr:ASKHA domain-containing protein [Eubacteriaceae bacterium]
MGTVKMTLSFNGEEHFIEEGTLLSKACETAGYPQDLVCGGNGKCGKCACEITDANSSGSVMACHYQIIGDITVHRIHNLANRKVNVLTSNTPLDCDIDPQLRAMSVTVADIAGSHCGGITDTIKEKFHLLADYSAMEPLSMNADSFEPESWLSLIIHKQRVIDVQPGANPQIYGMAIDIGTTTVACYIYDMETAENVGVYSALNSQTAIGADVISRIAYTIKNEGGVKTLQGMIVSTINSLLDLAEEDGIDTSKIYHVVLCGNSTMQHLFLGIYPANLGRAPFVSLTRDFVEIDAQLTGLRLNPSAKATFLPLLGGFVGADTTSVLISLPDDNKPRLVIDLGTNGEIACGVANRYYVASTACGPALEGAGLACGMRAAEGAIEHFHIIDKQVILKTITDSAPTGICGSGIIDILAELIKNNVVNKRGKMLSKDEYERKFGEDLLSARLEVVNEANAFILASAEESGNGLAIYLSQHDVRQIQLAKAAIATGCSILVDLYGIAPGDLHEICLSGAFGNYLDVHNAQFIGLLPNFEGVDVRSVGNGAGTGVQMYLLDGSSVAKCRKVQKNSEHTELNFQKDFKDTYFDEMLFKNGK